VSDFFIVEREDEVLLRIELREGIAISEPVTTDFLRLNFPLGPSLPALRSEDEEPPEETFCKFALDLDELGGV